MNFSNRLVSVYEISVLEDSLRNLLSPRLTDDEGPTTHEAALKQKVTHLLNPVINIR
jgi:hypothetical protein